MQHVVLPCAGAVGSDRGVPAIAGAQAPSPAAAAARRRRPARASAVAPASSRPTGVTPDRPPAVQAPPLAAPAARHRPGSTPFVWQLELCFASRATRRSIEAETYLYYIKLKDRQPAVAGQLGALQRDDRADDAVDDFKRLMGTTNFLDDLSIEVTDYAFPNGVVGKIVTYHMEERRADQDRRLPGLEGSRPHQDRREAARTAASSCVSTRFLDERVIRRVEGVVREMMAEKGFTNAEVSHKITPVAGGPKLVNVTFTSARARRSRSASSTSSATGDQRRHAAAADEGEQAEGHPLVHHRHAAPTRKRSSRRTRRRSSSTTAPRLCRAPASASPS